MKDVEPSVIKCALDAELTLAKLLKVATSDINDDTPSGMLSILMASRALTLLIVQFLEMAGKDVVAAQEIADEWAKGRAEAQRASMQAVIGKKKGAPNAQP